MEVPNQNPCLGPIFLVISFQNGLMGSNNQVAFFQDQLLILFPMPWPQVTPLVLVRTGLETYIFYSTLTELFISFTIQAPCAGPKHILPRLTRERANFYYRAYREEILPING